MKQKETPMRITLNICAWLAILYAGFHFGGWVGALGALGFIVLIEVNTYEVYRMLR